MKKFKITMAALALSAVLFAPAAVHAASNYSISNRVTQYSVYAKTTNISCTRVYASATEKLTERNLGTDSGVTYAEVYSTSFNGALGAYASNWGY